MSHLPINPLSPEEQQQVMEQMYLLLAKQVQSYHKNRHMGSNSSVPVELAQELMESIEYTISLVGGVYVHRDIEEAIVLGQEILENKLVKAKSMLKLVNGTAPQFQTECRWEALRYLSHYLDHYDHLHLSHIGPDDLFYPILISPPEGNKGIDSCLFYLNILWIENQIMAGVPDNTLEQFCYRLHAATLNTCEQLLINGVGKALIGSNLNQLYFDPVEYELLVVAMQKATDRELKAAAELLCEWLNIKNDDAKQYVQAIVPQLTMWIGENARNYDLYHLFM